MDNTEAERLAKTICAVEGLTLVGRLGAGSFKYAFCVEPAAGVKQTLKVYKSLAAAQDARTEREIDAISRCNHPGVVKFGGLKVHTEGNNRYAYSLEEYLEGESLERRLQSGHLSPEQVVAAGTELIEIVAHLHERELVHRDLKPANLMYRRTGELVAIDFGLVRDLTASSLTHTWAPFGPCSPFFAAPEQLNNQKDLIDWRTDQFAMGVVLTLAATGNHPFATSQDQGQTVTNVSKRRPPSQQFIDWTARVGLTCLPRMVSVWPHHRYLKPDDLRKAWASQKVQRS